mmetsp:Transcript_51170/g.112125  ORF Transcript_51170/g.112125 Transcript_51170/m.112125 type:complete len:707 (+) Transcript_51170:103-2223(+)
MQLFVAGHFASVLSLTPVEQVINMMAGLQAKIEKEGKDEATLYEKFGCFCRERTDQKSDEIADGAATVGDLTGELATLVSDRDTTNTDIASSESSIKSEQRTLEAENADWEDKVSKFNRDHDDLQRGKRECDDAIALLKAARPDGALVQVVGKLKSVVPLADALGYKSSARAMSFLQDPSSAGGLQNIIDIVEDLDQDFVTGIEDIQRTHLQNKHTHQDLVQTYKGNLDAFGVTLRDQQKELASLNEEIAETQKQLTRTQASLYDNQMYLKDLTDKCESKAKEWDQRAAMRADELGTISEAIAIVKGTVKTQADATSQSGHGQRVLLIADSDDELTAQTDGQQYKAEVQSLLAQSKSLLQRAQSGDGAAATPQFVQVAQTTRHLRARGSPRDRVVELLNSKASKLHSQVLAEVAAQAAAGDPFAKIKTLIQQMIERLLEEAGGDAEHEGWCNHEMEKTKQKRDYQSENVAAAAEEIHRLEARASQLEDQEAKLEHQISELTSAFNEANATRTQEHADNEEAVADAGEGKEAVEKAIDILTKFYKKAAKAKVELVQQPDDAPDTGFSGAYKGGQEENGGILGMLAVIQSDFARTIAETNKAETQAAREFTEFKKETNKSLAQKNAALTQTLSDLSETHTALGDEVQNLKTEQTGLNNAIVEWEKLRPACMNLGATAYAERKAAREDEIESLKQALCILADPAGAANC